MSIDFKFFSGFSASDSIWKDWTYIYSENINSTNPEFIEVSPKTQTLLKTNEKIDFLVFNNSSEFKDFLFVSGFKIFDKNWNIFYDHTKNISDFAWYVPNSSNIAFRGFQIAILNPDMSYTLYWPSIVERDWQKNFNELWFFTLYAPDTIRNFVRYLFRTVYTHNVLDFWGEVYISNHLLLKYKYGWEWWNVLTSSALSNVVWFAKQSTGFKSFTRAWEFALFSLAWWNTQSFWSVSDNYSLDIKILAYKWYSWVDYLFCNEGLFFLNWIIASPILYKNKSNYLDFEKANFVDLKWKYLKVWKFIFSITKTSKGFDLNVLGASSVWSPINFSSIVSKPWLEVSSIIEYKNGVLISYKDTDWKYWVDYFSFENVSKCESGYLITKEYFWNSRIELKKARELKFFCDKLKSWEYLKVSVSINNWDFEEIKTLTENDNWKNGYFSVLSFNREFHKIVFKLELKGDFKLYDFIFLDDKVR